MSMSVSLHPLSSVPVVARRGYNGFAETPTCEFAL